MKTWQPLADDPGDDLPPFAAARRAPSLKRTLAELPVLAAIAIALTFLVKSFVAQAFFIPSSSMEPQLNIGDRVVVSRTAYDLHDPRRGDIVVFDSPVEDGTPSEGFPRNVVNDVLETIAVKRPPDTELIKRVIGLPGETIEARDGVVYIDGRPLAEPYLPAGTLTDQLSRQVVPEGQVFVMGDNRANSHDSRFIGTIPIDSIVGRATARVWPPGRVAFL